MLNIKILSEKLNEMELKKVSECYFEIFGINYKLEERSIETVKLYMLVDGTYWGVMIFEKSQLRNI